MDMEGDDISVSATSFATTMTGRTKTIKEIAREERMALKKARKDLEMALTALPSPQFDYELTVPESVTEDEDQVGVSHSTIMDKDALDVENDKRNALFLEANKRFKMLTSVLKRQDIPRPFGVIERTGGVPVSVISDDQTVFDTDTTSPGNYKSSASQMILDEMYLLLEHDAFANPCLAQSVVTQANHKDRDKKDKSRRRQDALMTVPLKPSTSLESFSEENVHSAKMLINSELESANITKFHHAVTMSILHGIAPCDDEGIAEQVNEIRTEFESINEAANFLRKKADKLEAKLHTKNQGYAKRCDGIIQDILLRFAEFKHKKIESDVFTMLSVHEERGYEQRIRHLQDEIDILRESESVAQKRYGALLHEKTRYLIALKSRPTEK